MSSCGTLTYEDLKRRQSLPLEVKVNLSKHRIRQWYEHFDGLVYVSYSGGKDSTVLLDIVKSIYPDVPAVFCDTGLEYPEVRELALKNADVVLRPKMNFKQVIEHYGYPVPSKEQAQYIYELRTTKSEKLRHARLHGREGTHFGAVSKKWMPLVNAPFMVSNRCCDVMKKRPFKQYNKETGRVGMNASMAGESKQRRTTYLKQGCNAFDNKNPISTPMAFWTESDVLQYIVDRGIEYASCYGDIVTGSDGKLETTKEDRTGCMFCMFGISMEKEPNRFQRMQKSHPKQYEYCINTLGLGGVLDYIGIPYESQPTLFDAEEL